MVFKLCRVYEQAVLGTTSECDTKMCLKCAHKKKYRKLLHQWAHALKKQKKSASCCMVFNLRTAGDQLPKMPKHKQSHGIGDLNVLVRQQVPRAIPSKVSMELAQPRCMPENLNPHQSIMRKVAIKRPSKSSAPATNSAPMPPHNAEGAEELLCACHLFWDTKQSAGELVTPNSNCQPKRLPTKRKAERSDAPFLAVRPRLATSVALEVFQHGCHILCKILPTKASQKDASAM